MSESIKEKVVVGVVTAVILGALTLLFNWASQGGLVRALGGMTEKQINEKLAQIELKPGPKGDKGDAGADGATGPQGEKGDAGSAGASVKVEDVVAFLLANHKDDLRGVPGSAGGSVTVEEVAGFLVKNHSDELRGEKGDKGDAGDKGDKGDPGDAAFVPAGAVIAFDLPTGCPAGWKDMGEEWRGRMMVAALKDTNDKYGYGRIGGAETHTLTVAEMPRHDHGGKTGGTTALLNSDENNNRPLSHGLAGTGHVNIANQLSHNHKIEPQGGGKAHNNMPPYIALYFCKKEG